MATKKRAKPLPSEWGYEAKWTPGKRNIAFWNEVLVGKTITELKFDKKGLASFLLSDGQEVYLHACKRRATLAIQD
jgi:hypothetical protein